MEKSAVLLDITSIQKYIFASSKLKENLGASHLVSNVYESIISKNSAIEKGYIGGGNALFFFDEDEDKKKAEKFVEEWTKSLLVEIPGITVAAAIGDWNDEFVKSRDNLFDKLKQNKSKFIAQTITQRHGISAESSSDGYSMDIWSNSENEYVSAATFAKLEAYKEAKKNIEKEFKELLQENGEDKYCFTGELDNLGQSKGSENHIAIVHIDGNSMGDRFKSLSSLEDTRSLSDSLKGAVKESFEALLARIKEDLKEPNKKEYLKLQLDDGKTALPIRPIILGGDDITFVCEGRMGIYYAKIFMEEFAKQNVSDEKPLSSCAGIAVTKTKYPFYKGYQLAEELCSNAKKRWRENGKDGSWIDFHIAYGGFSGELKEIRELHFSPSEGSLIYRPYKINDTGEYGLDTLINNVKLLNKKDKQGKRIYPNNKLKELREVLTLGKAAALTFINEMNARELDLPRINGKKYDSELYDSKLTPYFDMLEMLEYYPEYELQGGANEKN